MIAKGSRTRRTGAVVPSTDGKRHHGATAQPARGTDTGIDGQGTSAPDHVVRQAKRHTQQALEAFVTVMQDGSAPAAARVAAATQILNWGHGRASGGESDGAPKTVKLAWEV